MKNFFSFFISSFLGIFLTLSATHANISDVYQDLVFEYLGANGKKVTTLIRYYPDGVTNHTKRRTFSYLKDPDNTSAWSGYQATESGVDFEDTVVADEDTYRLQIQSPNNFDDAFDPYNVEIVRFKILNTSQQVEQIFYAFIETNEESGVAKLRPYGAITRITQGENTSYISPKLSTENDLNNEDAVLNSLLNTYADNFNSTFVKKMNLIFEPKGSTLNDYYFLVKYDPNNFEQPVKYASVLKNNVNTDTRLNWHESSMEPIFGTALELSQSVNTEHVVSRDFTKQLEQQGLDPSKVQLAVFSTLAGGEKADFAVAVLNTSTGLFDPYYVRAQPVIMVPKILDKNDNIYNPKPDESDITYTINTELRQIFAQADCNF